MIEDKLTQDQRIRLECMAQAVASNAMAGLTAKTDPYALVKKAEVIEAYVREGGKDWDEVKFKEAHDKGWDAAMLVRDEQELRQALKTAPEPEDLDTERGP